MLFNASRKAEVLAPHDDVYPLRRCVPEVREWFGPCVYGLLAALPPPRRHLISVKRRNYTKAFSFRSYGFVRALLASVSSQSAASCENS